MAATRQTPITLVNLNAPSPALYRIECAAHSQPWSYQVFLQSNGTDYRWCEARIKTQSVGFTVCQQVVDELTLHNIAVSPQQQGKGIGAALIKDILAYAEYHQLTVFLEVRVSNSKARSLYQRVGFETVGRRPDYYRLSDSFEDGLVMRWTPKQTK